MLYDAEGVLVCDCSLLLMATAIFYKISVCSSLGHTHGLASSCHHFRKHSLRWCHVPDTVPSGGAETRAQQQHARCSRKQQDRVLAIDALYQVLEWLGSIALHFCKDVYEKKSMFILKNLAYERKSLTKRHPECSEFRVTALTTATVLEHYLLSSYLTDFCCLPHADSWTCLLDNVWTLISVRVRASEVAEEPKAARRRPLRMCDCVIPECV